MLAQQNLSSRFFLHLVENNRPYLDGLQKWLFHPGMLFQATETWWGEGKPRPAPHEGIDLCTFVTDQKIIKSLDENTKIPAAFAGVVVKIAPDFLGQSIYLHHDRFAADGRRLYTIYGHTRPLASLKIGQQVAEGQIIALLTGAGDIRPQVPPHLHISLAWMPVEVQPEQLNWQNLGRDPAITLLDPLLVFSPLS